MKHRRCITFIIAIIMLLSVFLPSQASDTASVKSELELLEAKLVQAAENRKIAEQAVNDAKNDKKDALTLKTGIDKKILALNNEIEVIEALIKGYSAKIEVKNSEIDQKQKELDEIYAVLKERIRMLHEGGEVDVLWMLFGAENIADFFLRIDRISCMLEYDERLMKTYNDGLVSLNEERDGISKTKTEAEAKMVELEERRAELESDLEEANALILSAEKDIATATVNLEEIERIEEQYNAQREKKLAELQAAQNNQYVGGEFLWPLDPEYTRISSGYGWRIHPVTGKRQFHRGIDIPAPYGSNIYAVNDGTVIEVSHNYADGYYVTVSHGGGVASFYSHLSKYNVKVGDKVVKGQIIANVGTSGYTTGAHLNLNIYKDSQAVNPLDYFK